MLSLHYMKHIYPLVFCLAMMAGVVTDSSAQAARGPMVSITSVNADQIKIYPNPASSLVTIAAPADKLGYITINNIIGKQIRKVQPSPDGLYDVSDLRKGVYIVRIFEKNGDLLKALRLSKV